MNCEGYGLLKYLPLDIEDALALPIFVSVFPHHDFRSDDTGKPTLEDEFLPLSPHVKSTPIDRGRW